jgi:Uncharacterized protein conserved in bacteria
MRLNYGNRELMHRARVLRTNMTKAEIILWSRLRSRKTGGYKFRRQQPILDYITDFYCDELRFIIEVDGEIHEEEQMSDFKRDNILKINGYYILHLSNLEVETNLNAAINRIISFINEISSPSQGDHRGSQR